MSDGSPTATESIASEASTITIAASVSTEMVGAESSSSEARPSGATATLTQQSSLDKKMQKKVLVRSEAVNETEGSPTPNVGAYAQPQEEINSSLLTVQTLPVHAGKGMSLKQQGSGSTEGSFSSLSRDSSTENYTDSTGIDLDRFLRETLAGPAPKDRQFLLRLEAILIDLILDQSRDGHKFEKMTSYHRMFVHRVAAYFGLDHNIDPTGQCVVVNKTKTTRIPEFNFRRFVDSLDLANEGMDTLAPAGHEARLQAKQILKRESSSFDDTSGISMGSKDKSPDRLPVISDNRSRSLEQREEDYLRVRNRIFASHSMDVPCTDPSVRHSIERANSSESGTGYRSGHYSANQGRLTKGRSFPSTQFTAAHVGPRGRISQAIGVPSYADYAITQMMSALNLATMPHNPQMGPPPPLVGGPPMAYHSPQASLGMAPMMAPSPSGQPFFYLPSHPSALPPHHQQHPMHMSPSSQQQSQLSYGQPMIASHSQTPPQRHPSAPSASKGSDYRPTSSPYGQQQSQHDTMSQSASMPPSNVFQQQTGQYPVSYMTGPMMGPPSDPSGGGMIYAPYPQAPMMLTSTPGGVGQPAQYQQMVGVQFMNPSDPSCMGQPMNYSLPPQQHSLPPQLPQASHPSSNIGSQESSQSTSYALMQPSHGGGYTTSVYSTSGLRNTTGVAHQQSHHSFDSYSNPSIPLGQSASSPGMCSVSGSTVTQQPSQSQPVTQYHQYSLGSGPPPPLLPSPVTGQVSQPQVMYTSGPSAQQSAGGGMSSYPPMPPRPLIMQQDTSNSSTTSYPGGGGGDGSCESPSRTRAPKLKHMKRPK